MLISPQHRRVFTNKIHRPYFHGITVKSVYIPTLLLWQYHCSHPHATLMQYTYSVTQKKSPLRFSDIFLKWLGIFKSILHTYYTFISTLDYKFLFNYLQFWWSYAILSETTHQFFYISLELVSLLTEQMTSLLTSCHIQHVCWHYKAADLGWFATNNDQQSYQWLSQTYERVHFSRWWTLWAYYVNLVVALSTA